MRINRELVAPYMRWGIVGLVFGAIVGGLIAPLFEPSAAGAINEASMRFALGGAGVGFVLGCGYALFIHMWYGASKEAQFRKRAEAKDPTIVHGMYLDIETGDEGAAWTAVALLSSYLQPEVTEHMLKSVVKRMENRKILTMDKYAILRHAIKCVQNTRSLPNMEKLHLLAESPHPDIAGMATRMGLGKNRRSSESVVKK